MIKLSRYWYPAFKPIDGQVTFNRLELRISQRRVKKRVFGIMVPLGDMTASFWVEIC
jgi:hypothetical protein